MSALAGTTVLVVDDNPDINEMVCEALGFEGATTIASPGLMDARTAVDDCGQLDLVVCDVQLADGSGLDLIPSLRDRFDETAVIMISGRPLDVADLPDRVQFLAKPFTLREIVAAAVASVAA
ncbi:MAG: response regulator [Acidimicrobiales bacterium]